MPLYALICTECDRVLEETVMSMAEREKARCPDRKCRGKLTNDYARQRTSNFSLRGDNWPSKQIRIENQIMREKHLD